MNEGHAAVETTSAQRAFAGDCQLLTAGAVAIRRARVE
jgi:hypothetical protein